MGLHHGGLSRRDVVRVGGGFFAASLLGSAAAGAGPGSNEEGNSQAKPLVDPTKAYPRPPFQSQHQERPGLACEMIPPPDHGESSYKGSGKLAGRKALITGGDSGIGRAAAIAFAREGADVAFGFLPAEQRDADAVIGLIEGAGRKAVPLPGDIRTEEVCNRLVADAVEKLGGLDILVSNAAYQQYQEDFTKITTQQFDDTFKTNVYAMFWIIRAALPHMKAGSSIICTTSINAFDPSPGILDYAMTKAAIANLVQGLGQQLGPKGIRINGVAPGPVWTPLQPSGGQSDKALPQFGGNTPMQRPGQPAELAATYVLLASQESSYSTGEVYAITGGKPLF